MTAQGAAARARRGVEELRRSFPVAPEALSACEAILHAQCRALDESPPMEALPPAVRLAAAGRLRSGEIVIPPERFPLEIPRVERLLRQLVFALREEPAELTPRLGETLVDAALAAAMDDGEGVANATAELGPPAEAGALVRESLKPELLRTSQPFTALVGDARRERALCPLCGSRPSCGTRDLQLLCRWCGLLHPWTGSACMTCGKKPLRTLEPTIVRGALLLACDGCGEVIDLFDASPDPLVLSLHAVLAGPLELAARVRAGNVPRRGFSVF